MSNECESVLEMYDSLQQKVIDSIIIIIKLRWRPKEFKQVTTLIVLKY